MTGSTLISPTELKSLMESEACVVIDTRNGESYAAGHLPGAVNMHDIFTYLATSSTEGMSELTGKFAEEFGAGIMSAIDFDLTIDRVESPKSDRVKVSMTGNFSSTISGDTRTSLPDGFVHMATVTPRRSFSG